VGGEKRNKALHKQQNNSRGTPNMLSRELGTQGGARMRRSINFVLVILAVVNKDDTNTGRNGASENDNLEALG